MTEADVRQAAIAYPDVDVRQLTHVIEDAAAEAAAGLTAVRVVCGWRVVVDRRPPGDWLITAVPMAPKPYPPSPPNGVLVVAICIATEAGASQDVILSNTKFDCDAGELRLQWMDVAKESAA